MIELHDLHFAYQPAGFALHVPELSIQPGEAAAMVGPSGCGKTTLLWLIGGILSPQRGAIRVDNVDLHNAPDRHRRRFRIERVGFIFQDLELLDYLTVRDNILLPYRIHRALRLDADARRYAESLADAAAIADKLHRHPHTLSQGERQRVAICRALVTDPPLILADEPTSSLDPATAAATLDAMLTLVRSRSATLLMLTHDRSLLHRFDRVIDATAFAATTDYGAGDSDAADPTEAAGRAVDSTEATDSAAVRAASPDRSDPSDPS